MKIWTAVPNETIQTLSRLLLQTHVSDLTLLGSPTGMVTLERRHGQRVELNYCRFKVGPFQFAIATTAVVDEPIDLARRVMIDGAALVPPRYRQHLDAHAAATTLDSLVLKRGRVALAGILRVGEFKIADDAIVARGMRAEAPWIAGSVREPPSFVIDPDALQLHFLRRAG